MAKKVPESTPKLVGECSHSKFLPFGAFTVLALYWAAKYPAAYSAIPHITGMMNSTAGALSVMISGQFVRQAKTTMIKWWSHHVEVSGRLTVWLGKKGEQLPP